MIRRVLLDANLLIGVFDDSGETSERQRNKSKVRMHELLTDPSVALAITPLIRYEVLRGIQWTDQEQYAALRSVLEDFEEFDISRDVSELAADLYRYDQYLSEQNNENKNLEKRKFDVFHFASAECNELELATEDGGFVKLQALYRKLKLSD